MKHTLSTRFAWFGAASLVAGALGLPSAASAVPVSALADATQLIMPIDNNFRGSGPKELAPGITWTSTGANSMFGNTDGYSFDANGDWDYKKTMVATNDDVPTTMTFTFDTAVSGFGGFFNWAPTYGTVAIAAYDASHALLESLDFDFKTDGSTNAGQFLGFRESSDIIKYFTITGLYVAGADFAVQTVPEPGTLALFALGLLGLLGRTARRNGDQA